MLHIDYVISKQSGAHGVHTEPVIKESVGSKLLLVILSLSAVALPPTANVTVDHLSLHYVHVTKSQLSRCLSTDSTSHLLGRVHYTLVGSINRLDFGVCQSIQSTDSIDFKVYLLGQVNENQIFKLQFFC